MALWRAKWIRKAGFGHLIMCHIISYADMLVQKLYGNSYWRHQGGDKAGRWPDGLGNSKHTMITGILYDTFVLLYIIP